VRWKYPPGKAFSNGVAPTVTPFKSTVAPGGLLVIFKDWADVREAQPQKIVAHSAARGIRSGGNVRERGCTESLPRLYISKITYLFRK